MFASQQGGTTPRRRASSRLSNGTPTASRSRRYQPDDDADQVESVLSDATGTSELAGPSTSGRGARSSAGPSTRITSPRPPSRPATQPIKEEDDQVEVDDHEAITNSTTNSAGYSHSRSRQHAHPSSFFLRERSDGPPSQNDSFASTSNPNSHLLRGTQRVSRNPLPLSPPSRYDSVGFNSFLSSEAEDSRGPTYSYEAEERIAAELEARQSNNQNPTPNPQSWLSNFSPFHRNTAKTSKPNTLTSSAPNHRPARAQDSDSDQDGDHHYHHQGAANPSDSSRRPSRRRPRTSKDNLPYRPESNEELDDDESDVSTGGRKHSHRRRSKNDWPNMREGRDDNKIWGLGRKRRKRPKKLNANGDQVGDSSYADTTMDTIALDDNDDSLSPEKETQSTSASRPNAAGVSTSRKKRNADSRQQNPTESSLLSSFASFLKDLALGLASFLFFAPVFLIKKAYESASAFGWTRTFQWIVAPILIVMLIGATVSPDRWGSSPTPALGDRDAIAKSRGLFSLLSSLWSSSEGRHRYHVPFEPPSSLDELVERLSLLEGTVQDINQILSTEQETSASLSKSQKEILRRIGQLEDASVNVMRQIKDMDTKRAAQEQEATRTASQMASDLATSQSEIDHLRRKLQTIQDDAQRGHRDLDTTISKLAKRIAQAEARMERTAKSMDNLNEAVQRAEAASSRALEMLNPLQDSLPDKMPVRKDPRTGHVQIDPGFWLELRKVFVTLDQQASDATRAPANNPPEAPVASWEAFRSSNEAALRAMIASEFGRSVEARQRDGTLLGRRDFMDLLHAELAQAKQDLSERFNENVGEIQNDILAKVRAQNEMYEKSGSWRPKGASAPARHSPRADTSGSGGANVPDVDLTLKDGTNAKSAVLALIDAALETYAADRIGKRDFALYSAGGRVLPSLTSPTLQVQQRRSTWLSLLGSRSSSGVKGRPPVVAIHHDNAPGLCWPFAGQTGSLGIQLARKVAISDVSIEHAPRSLAYDDSNSAPREVVVWGIVESASDLAKVRQYRQHVAADASAEPIPPPPSPNHVLVASATYDVAPGSRAVQTFPASDEMRALEMPLSVVHVQVVSNHGNPDFTCLYRVRVHGSESRSERPL